MAYRPPRAPHARSLAVAVSFLAAILVAAAPAAAQLVPAGGPFRVDADAGWIAVPARVLPHPDGGFLAFWQQGPPDSGTLWGRRFDAAGPAGPAVDFGVGRLGDVAVAADRTLLVTGDGTVRRLALDGSVAAAPVAYDDAVPPPGAVRRDRSGDGERAAAVAPAAGGDFAVAWRVDLLFADPDAGPREWSELRVRRFGPGGLPLGPSSVVSEAYRIEEPRLAPDEAGGWVLTARRLQTDWSEWESGVRATVGADGTVAHLPEPYRVWDVGSACAAGHSLTVYTQSGWGWESDDGDCTGVFGLPAGAAGDLGPEPVDLPRDVRDCQWNARVAPFAGGFVAAWQTSRFDDAASSGGNPFHGLSLRAFDAAGRPGGDPLDLRLAVEPAPDPHLDDLAAAGELVAVVGRVRGQLFVRLAQRVSPGPCVPGPGHLCLGGAASDRFRLDSAFLNPYAGDRPGRGKAAPLTADTGAFWFFSPGNLELLVKVLDGRPVNGRWWVLAGAASTVEWWLTVTDTVTREQWGGAVAPYLFATVADTAALPRPPAAPDPSAALPRPPGLPDTREDVLVGERYRVRVHWTNPRTGGEGAGRGAAVADDTALFWFFAPANLELMVKVLDGRPVNGWAWVLWATTTDVAFELEVEDTETGAVRRYVNEPFHLGGGADTAAFH